MKIIALMPLITSLVLQAVVPFEIGVVVAEEDKSKFSMMGLRGLENKPKNRLDFRDVSKDPSIFDRDLLSDEVVKNFKIDHDIRSDVQLEMQVIQEDEGNTVTINGKVYSLNDLEPMDIYSNNATYIIDDEPKSITSVSSSNAFVGKDGSDTIMVTKGPNGDVLSVDIIGEDGSDTYMAAVVPGVLATITPETLDMESLSKFEAEDMASTDTELLNRNLETKIDPHEETSRNLPSSTDCSSYKVIEVAVAMDSSFCTLEGGSGPSRVRAENVVARTSLMYQAQGVCAKLQISHMEIYCTASRDPYAAGIALNDVGCSGTYGLLNFFTDYWAENKASVRRDTAHLFYGEDLAGNSIGCAYIGVLCNTYYGYGVDQMQFSTDLQRQGMLFAHELGHNVGLGHVSNTASSNYIMNSVGFSEPTWSSQSVSDLRVKLPTISCLETITNPSSPTRLPTRPPTRPPVSAPTPSGVCINDRSFSAGVRKNGRPKDCAWIGEKDDWKNGRRKRFCKLASVRNACPMTCGFCCRDDPTWHRFNKKGKKRDCLSFKGKTCGREVKSVCPVSCNDCKSEMVI